jgi:hypothetical protein
MAFSRCGSLIYLSSYLYHEPVTGINLQIAGKNFAEIAEVVSQVRES